MTIAPGTTAFYDAWAVSGEESPRSAMSRHFESAFAAGARVLDIGCGKGRDVVALLDMGFEAWGVEPNDAMRARARPAHARARRSGRDPDGRAFVNHAPDRVQELLAAFGFALLRREDIPTPSTDTRWRVLLFEREAKT